MTTKYDEKAYHHATVGHVERVIRMAVCETTQCATHQCTWESQYRLRDATEGVVDPPFDVFAVWLSHLGTFGE